MAEYDIAKQWLCVAAMCEAKAQSLYLKQRIFELKAKLYDMMTGGEVEE